MGKRIFFAGVALVVFAIGALPVLSMLIRSIWADGHLSLTSYRGVLTSARQWTLMGHSLSLALLVTGLTVTVGTPLGVLLTRSDLPWRRFFTGVFVLPLLIPSYVIAVSWSDFMGCEGLGSRLSGIPCEATRPWLFGLPGCGLVLFSAFVSIPMLFTMIFLRTIPSRLEEAGRLVAGWGRVLGGITIPLILPGVLLSAMLVFILAFGEFSVPDFLRYDVFPVESFVRFSAFYDFRAATAAALPLVAVTLILLAVEAVFLRERTYRIHPLSESGHRVLIELGPHRGWLFAVVAALGFVVGIMPVAALLIQSSGLPSYIEALERAGGSLARSLGYAVVGATLLTILGFVVGYLIQARTLGWGRLVDSSTVFLFALPSTVIGIGLVSLWNTPWTNLVSRTPMIIILGYLAKYTALTSRICVTRLGQIPPSMEEAAQAAGAGWFRRLVWIVVPMTRRGLVAAWVVGYIFSMRDTGITMLVYPAGHETLPVRIFTLMANGSPELIAALCVVLTAVTLLPVGLLGLARTSVAGKAVR